MIHSKPPPEWLHGGAIGVGLIAAGGILGVIMYYLCERPLVAIFKAWLFPRTAPSRSNMKRVVS
jgi:peptidoglycan/LPS O-acetylase OafA/YrhL